MLLDESGKPYSEAELNPPKYRTPCEKCGCPKKRQVQKGFGGHWRLTCQQCGYEFAHGRGELPEGEV